MDPTSYYDAPDMAFVWVEMVADAREWPDEWTELADDLVVVAYAKAWAPWWWSSDKFWATLYDLFIEYGEGAPDGWDEVAELWLQSGVWSDSFDDMGIGVADLVDVVVETAEDTAAALRTWTQFQAGLLIAAAAGGVWWWTTQRRPG